MRADALWEATWSGSVAKHDLPICCGAQLGARLRLNCLPQCVRSMGSLCRGAFFFLRPFDGVLLGRRCANGAVDTSIFLAGSLDRTLSGLVRESCLVYSTRCRIRHRLFDSGHSCAVLCFVGLFHVCLISLARVLIVENFSFARCRCDP